MRAIASLGLLILFISCEEKQLKELSVSSESELAIQEQVCYFFADPMEYPSFPGGEGRMLQFIEENMRHPPICAEGKVFVWFVVEENGAVANVQIARGISEHHDAEAIRLVKSFPIWEPGKQAGIRIRTRMLVPISF